jgi:micrococcal nuclease
MRRLVLPLAAAVVAVVLFALGSAHDGRQPRGPLVGRVVRVVDGDTIKVKLGDLVERVRYIGMDTPESVKPGTPVQCFAKKASAENARLVAGREVRLVPDAEARDRYGRLLAYVYPASGGPMVNEVLVRRGYARPLTIPPNVSHAARFAALARGAREAGRGLWSACRSS